MLTFLFVQTREQLVADRRGRRILVVGLPYYQNHLDTSDLADRYGRLLITW